MKNRRLLFMPMIAVLILSMVMNGADLAYTPPGPDNKPWFHIDPDPKEFVTTANLTCTTFDIDVRIYNVSAARKILGYEFQLWYNSSLIKATKCTQWNKTNDPPGVNPPGTSFGPLAPNMTWIPINNTVKPGVGRVWVMAALPLAKPWSGSATAIKITFHIEQAPPYGFAPPKHRFLNCTLALNGTVLGDTAGEPIPHGVDDGFYNYKVPQKIPIKPVADFTYTPTAPWECSEVTCTSTSTPNGGEIIAWLWEIEGPATNTTAMDGEVMKFHCDEGGYVNVTLTVWDTEGVSATIMKQIYVRAHGRAMLFVHPSLSTVTINETFKIGVIINDIIKLYSFEFKLGYNTTILDVIDAWVMWPDFCIINEAAGIIWVNASCPYPYPFSGNGTLAAITFTVTEFGSCVLDLHNTMLIDFYALPFPHDAIDGYVHACSAPTIDSYYPLTNPTIKEGESQEFNITKSDLDGDRLTVTWLVNQSDTGETSDSYTYTANYESAGTYNVTVIVSDGLFQVSHQWTLTVTNVERDIAIINLVLSKKIIGGGYPLYIYVTIINQGDSTETFDVTAYANTITIATQTITLTSGNSMLITFTWNTAGVVKGNYTITTTAIPLPGEADTTDNTRSCWVVVTGLGDVNGDFTVNILDAILVLIHAGPIPPNPPECDVNCDGKVNVLDVILCLINAGPVK